jgi:hypothetical protein
VLAYVSSAVTHVSEHVYWNAVRSLVEEGQGRGLPKQQISDQIVVMVESAAGDGEIWAMETLARWASKGAKADYTQVFKDMNSTFYIRADGRRVRKTTAYSRPKRSKVTGDIIGRQMQSWWGMNRAAVVELRREIWAQGERIDDLVAALDQLVAAIDRHPECATAQDAWEADGRDVDEIDLSNTGT